MGRYSYTGGIRSDGQYGMARDESENCELACTKIAMCSLCPCLHSQNEKEKTMQSN